MYYPLKKSKTILAAQGGQGPPLALPCGRPCITPIYSSLIEFIGVIEKALKCDVG